MNPIEILFDNKHDAATLTASSQQSPPEYTQVSGGSHLFRTLGIENETLTADLGSALYMTKVVIYGHNLSPAGTINVELLLNGDAVAETGFKGVAELIPLGRFRVGIDPWGGHDLSGLSTVSFEANFQPTIANAYRITINDPTNVKGYLEIGRVFSGAPWSPPKDMNISYGVSMNNKTATRKERTEGGSLIAIGKGGWREVSLSFDHLEDAEFENFVKEMNKTDDTTEVYINVYPEKGGVIEAIHSFAAMRQDGYGTTHNFYNSRRVPLTYVEV
ncbi:MULTISPECIES: hypothetical protein [Halomonadaceae]|uniref:Uncharacterized protein n=1 Tax=Vreelandella titanicae TaxID=664683 RepID=A0AAP9NL25_9GAMM|nr:MULTISPECIES: hypothetical protein [Halomonas]QKS24178.1 hypothetical protein FX987_01952 [Halomonas titanicae]CDG54577.1 hypothetical protein HALA3H3_790056 [Halomonas sp. A3H3]|tara:strand:- start:438 stop:1259 length:822 start_codon:yes stop_codon:yes gene_type:complete